MDATQADIYLVSRSDRSTVIGRPYIYLAVDTASQIIAGVYIGFDAGLKSVISCLANAARDKKEFCAEYGIDIAEEQWPSICCVKRIVTQAEMVRQRSILTLQAALLCSTEWPR